MEAEINNYLEYYKLNKFFQNILIDNNVSQMAFGEQLLDSISDVFGFDKSTFWLINPDNGKYLPISYRVDSSIIEEYAKQYYKIDPFYPDNFIKNKINKDVVSVNDLMPFDEYESSAYYTKFLAPVSQYYYQTVLYLRHKGIIIGGIVLLRSKNEGDFNKKEIDLMKKATIYLSTITANYLLDNELRIKQGLYKSLCNQSPVGLIVFNAYYPYKIQYINSSAIRYTLDILDENLSRNPTEQFIKQHIINANNFEQFGSFKTIISHSLKKYNLNVTPSQTADNTPLVHAYIIPQNTPSEIQNILNMNNYNDLTVRQKEIIKYVLHGFTNQEISEKLFISVSTVKTHLNNIFKELQVSNRLSLYSKLIGKNEVF